MIRQTSRDAFKSAKTETNTTRVLNMICNPPYVLGNNGVGVDGITCDEAQVWLGMSHQTCSPCFTALANKELIEDSGKRRKTRAGRDSIVWRQSIPTNLWHEKKDSIADVKRAVISAAKLARSGGGWQQFDIAVAKLSVLERLK